MKKVFLSFKIYNLFIGIIIFQVCNLNMDAQYPFKLNDKDFKAYNFKVPIITDTPTLNSGMPLEVMAGYLIFDSLAHTQNLDSVEAFIERIKNTDTLKMICKYLLITDNYNPILLRQNYFYNDTIQRFTSLPFSLREIIYEAIYNSNQFDYLDKLILMSSYVYKIKVFDIYSIYDSTSFSAPTEKDISCTIEKKFKGNIAASCNNYFMNNNTIYNSNNQN